MATIKVRRGRTNVKMIFLGRDVSADTFVSEIKADKLGVGPVIAAWDISFLTDGTDGKLVLTLDDSVVADIPASIKKGYMDVKQITGGEPIPAHDGVITVKFLATVTS